MPLTMLRGAGYRSQVCYADQKRLAVSILLLLLLAGCGGTDGLLCDGTAQGIGPEISAQLGVALVASSTHGDSGRENWASIEGIFSACERRTESRFVDLDLCATPTGCGGDVLSGTMLLTIHSESDERNVVFVIANSAEDDLYTGEADVDLAGTGTLATVELVSLSDSETASLILSRSL